jgi:ribosomal-protein-alanine N-acetyltransferase
VLELQRLRPDHESALLDFELTNRTYFAQSISDRGDEFYEDFAERHSELLAEQAADAAAFYVLIDDDGAIVGRFNLYELVDGRADVGYRVAERVAGRGIATAAVRDLCRIARDDFALRTLRATASNDNVASQRVLENSGFTAVGPTHVHGQDAQIYERDLADSGIGS